MDGPSPGQFLSKIVERDIPVMSVISNPVIESPEVMSGIAKTLSSEAINLGFKGILEQLGQHSDIATAGDVFEDVPDVMPVRKVVCTPHFSKSFGVFILYSPETIVGTGGN